MSLEGSILAPVHMQSATNGLEPDTIESRTGLENSLQSQTSPAPAPTCPAEPEGNANEGDGPQESLLSESSASAPPSYMCSVRSHPPLLTPLVAVAPSILTERPPPSPPSYAEAVRTGRLTFVDFSPKCLNDGGILASPKYERFE